MAKEVFNRYEVKYMLSTDQKDAVIEVLLDQMNLDPYNSGGKYYTICNIYYDTEDNTLIQRSLSLSLIHIYILRGRMDAGTLVQFTTYASMIYGPINYMISLPRSIADAVAAAARVFDILDNEPKVRDAEQPKEPELKGKMCIRDSLCAEPEKKGNSSVLC